MKKFQKNYGRTQEKGRGLGRETPDPPPDGAARGGNAPGPQAPARPGAQEHVQPGPPLQRPEAEGEQRRYQQRAEEDIPQRRGQPRPVAHAAQDIVQKAEPPAQQQEKRRLLQLCERRKLHQRKSLAQKPEAGPDSS